MYLLEKENWETPVGLIYLLSSRRSVVKLVITNSKCILVAVVLIVTKTNWRLFYSVMLKIYSPICTGHRFVPDIVRQTEYVILFLYDDEYVFNIISIVISDYLSEYLFTYSYRPLE